MAGLRSSRVVGGVLIVLALGVASMVQAQLSLGTWVKRSDSSPRGGLTMTIEACCNGGRRIVYRAIGRSDVLMTIESPFDGTEVPVLVGGKPSGETMAIKRLDDHHSITVVKMNGTTVGTSRAEISADGNTLTVENETTAATGQQPLGKKTETWVRQK
jgi:hypothetical protein